ncbi:hypothetical protein EC957_001586 [Mortierella hygrophila]|uniref:Protein kinase domain-containing protein n=1 Tax=Mortierella hygrophila TaxID=979708 RepID=A0A9P6FGL9_9FUNG|nr:hypothetical protein EC957_001586 [Mortierella hygrophila]
MANDRTQSAQVKKNNRAEEWLKNAVKDKHVRLIPFSEISKVKYNVAKGGSGTIHLGAWRNMHVAIKEQHNTNDLIKELKMHKQVHDSNYIVKFFGITKHPLTHDTCIVMQFAENGCLQDYLETQNVAISWLTKYRLAWEVASGLDFIHRENIFHTDLHSRNILIDTGGKALITDFGLSKSVNKTIYTTKAGLFGVVPYVAPERMQNPSITYTAKCDIYSLGVILWELSSCVIPFEAQLQDVMLAVNIIAGVREKTIPGTAVEYEMLYRRCWDGLPQNRPQMDIVLSELVELLAAEQINPRPAATRPRSPKPTRPLSSDSMVAPSLPFAYETEASQPPSLENTHHVGPGSPSRALTRQSLGKASMVGVPSVPIRQDRTGATRVSFHEPHPRDNSQINGTKSPGPAQLDANNRNGAVKATPLAIKKGAATNAQAEAHTTDAMDSPILPNGHAASETAKPPQPSNTTPEQGKDKEQQQQKSKEQKLAESCSGTALSTSDADSKPAGSILELLPPLPEFHQLSFSPNSSGSNDGHSLTTAPPPPTPSFTQESSLNRLPGDAVLALARGLPMFDVVSKLPQASFKNISTISPPPSGAPPPPPGAVAGHSNTPRVISPPHHRNTPRASKTISPPAGAPPPRSIPSPSLGPGAPRPPPGSPPTPKLGPASGNGTNPGPAGVNGTNATGSRNPVEPIQYTPSTSYSPGPGKNLKTGQPNGSSSPFNGNSEQSTLPPAASTNADTTRPTPARQIPMGFPVVTPLSPPHWTRTPTPVATEPPSTVSRVPASFASSGSSPSSSAGSSPSGSPSSTSPSTTPSSVNGSPPTNRRDFRPISYLTQKHTGLLDLVEQVDQQLQAQQQQQQQHQHQQHQQQQPHVEPPPRRNGDNTYVPNPNNNIIPPSQLLMQRAQSPELIRLDNNILGSPSLRPAPLPENGNRIIRSPHLAPLNRPTSPAFMLPTSNRNNDRTGGLFAGDAKNWMRTLKNPTRRDSEEDDARSVSDYRPQLPSKDSSSSTTTTTGTSLSTSPSTPTSANGNGSTPSSFQPRVQANTFYSISDPYKEMNHDEPTDFFAAVTQSDLATIERMLKSFPHLIHDSNGFWPHPTPLLVAARSRRALETMKVLLQHGAALDRGDHNGTTVLHYVCEQYPNPVDAIQFLVRAGADPNSRDAKKRTPLIVLLQNTHLVATKVLLEAMRTLFKAGAQANVVEAQYQRSALHVAIMHYQPPAPNQQHQQQGQSHQGNGGPVMVAGGIQIGKDLAPVLELLLKRGADVNARDARKATPLHVLLERMDNEELVQMLLLYGADPGIRTNRRNALMIAAEHLRVMSAWFLLENDLLSSNTESIKRATELCSKADGPDKSAKPLLKNTLSDWQGKEGKQRRIQLAQDCVLRVQRTPDMKTIDQTAAALEFLESVGQPIHRASAVVGSGRGDIAVGGFGGAGSTVGGGGGYGVSSSNNAYGTGSGNQHYHHQHNVSPTTSSTSHR